MTELHQGQPSKYHKYQYDKDDDDKLVGRWVLNQQHSDLRSTATCNIHNHHYCAYCGERARPIQARLGGSEWGRELRDWHYETTGHTCDCKKARLERKFQEERNELERKTETRRRALYNRYSKRLAFDRDMLLEVKHRVEAKQVSMGFGHDILEISDTTTRRQS